MINVALVSHSPDLHGAERCLLNITALFKNSNVINTTLMIPVPKNGQMSEVAANQGYNMVYTPPNPWYIYKSPKNEQDFNEFCKYIKDYKEEYINIFKEIDANIVLVNTLTNFIPCIAGYELRLPIITWIHGVLDSSIIPGIDPSYQSVIDRKMINLSNHLIYNSGWTESQFQKSVCNMESVVIPNWYLEPEYNIPHSHTNNLFVCLNSMDKKKGNNILIKAAKIIKDRDYDFHVDLYGIGPEKEEIIALINYLNLNDCVSLKGTTTNVSKVYNESLALIQPSLFESFGRTIIEAMAHKKPVIASKTADPENIVKNGVSGFRIEPDNSQELAEKMIFILKNPVKSKKMGKKGYAIYKKKYDGVKAQKTLEALISRIYKMELYHTPYQQLVFDSLNLIHNQY